ncbi:MAG: hypothetical protein K1X88_13905 [Nannocystaceae bacterium]|nr:hypothetical protein [Nannocystaceae bacterium]
MPTALTLSLVLAVSARWSFEDAYDDVAGGAWYQGQNNEDATLAWGESYVMASLAAMARATNHPMYLDRLAEHIDAVLAQRDDARGVADWRGISGPCWRNTSYQSPTPYCYAVHTGMLVTPMLEFVAAVEASPWAQQAGDDGETLASKAERYLVAAQESVAFHDDEWNDGGYYVFPDVPNLAAAGQIQPLNQSNALGRAHLLLAALTGDAGALAKATALATRFRAQISTGADGALLWNYGAGAYAAPGEDISHAAINVEFAVLAAQHGVVFDDTDLAGLATTFRERIYLDDATFSDFIGGGSTNGDSYRAQIGRWVVLAPWSASTYAAVRDAYDRDYAPPVGSGSVLLGWALLAEHEPLRCAPFFYVADWDDQGDVREATAYGANLQTIPPALQSSCLVPVEHDAPRPTVVAQWDGEAYHRVASWTASGAAVRKHIPYDPRFPFVYARDGVLFEFEDAFVDGDGIVVHEPAELVPPTIESEPPATAVLDQPLDYVPVAGGDEPRWWSLIDAPGDARIDPASGAIAWTPDAPGDFDMVIRLENDVGAVEQAFSVHVDGFGGLDLKDDPTAADEGSGTNSGTSGSGDVGSSGVASSEGGGSGVGSSPATSREDGCSCTLDARGRAWWLVFAAVPWARRRRAGLNARASARSARSPR